MIVLDASAAVDLLLRRGRHTQVEPLVREHEVAGPDLLTAEVLHVLRRFEHRGELGTTRAAEAVEDLLDLPLEVYPLSPLARAMWSMLADVSAYDAAYVALAAGLDAQLLTTDDRLARTARRHCRVVDL